MFALQSLITSGVGLQMSLQAGNRVSWPANIELNSTAMYKARSIKTFSVCCETGLHKALN
ncbi:hypothetical protein EXN66_Car001261 [Channa argus]|uniref:Uncharacterized protein n=1 Tax=Channa argus TaxID=215402 RepID=A0A6G1R0V0_CHAAH|nr:hypothetical protein EXN66_Car001261 [Channa argus]